VAIADIATQFATLSAEVNVNRLPAEGSQVGLRLKVTWGARPLDPPGPSRRLVRSRLLRCLPRGAPVDNATRGGEAKEIPAGKPTSSNVLSLDQEARVKAIYFRRRNTHDTGALSR
jgi:hypothetical protein